MGYFITILVIIILLFAPKKKKRNVVINIPEPENVEDDPLSSPDCFVQDGEDETDNFPSESYNYEQAFVDTQNESLEEIFAKNAPYFSYDDVLSEEGDMGKNTEKTDTEKAEINTQSVENEEEITQVDLKNPDELKKAIIYKEILQNPYI